MPKSDIIKPVVAFIHLYPSFEDIELGVVPNFNELRIYLEAGICLELLHSKYYNFTQEKNTKESNSYVEKYFQASSRNNNSKKDEHPFKKMLSLSFNETSSNKGIY